jgi:hypothetical protein
MKVETSKTGRPSLRTPELEAEILDRLADDEGLYQVAESPNMPERHTIMRWAREDDDFRSRYVRAMEAGSDAQIDDCGKIARTEPDVNRAKLIIDTAKWRAGRIAPQRWGDRTALQMLDEHGKPAKAGITIIVDGAPSE